MLKEKLCATIELILNFVI